MGMTWCICEKNKNFDYAAHKNDGYIDAIVDNSFPIVDDMVFDRECLGMWMGLTEADYDKLYEDAWIPITRQHIERALKTLEDTVAKVKSMPFEEDGTAAVKKCWFDDAEKKWKYEYEGTPKNIEILKVVTSVFNKEYHFNFPWEKNDFQVGVPEMISALKETLVFMDENPDSEVIVFYY